MEIKEVMAAATVKEAKHEALRKWRYYVEAEKKDPKNKLYTTLKKYYHALRNGKTLVDIYPVIRAGGRHTPDAGNSRGWPKLAIAPASAKRICCEMRTDGTTVYEPQRNNTPKSLRVYLDKLFTEGVTFSDSSRWSSWVQAPVPMIPPHCLPKEGLNERHFILWEVARWEPMPPEDPYLLQRISHNVFSIEAQWDLTEVERLAMQQFLR
jgi:hypothetical protein